MAFSGKRAWRIEKILTSNAFSVVVGEKQQGADEYGEVQNWNKNRRHGGGM